MNPFLALSCSYGTTSSVEVSSSVCMCGVSGKFYHEIIYMQVLKRENTFVCCYLCYHLLRRIG